MEIAVFVTVVAVWTTSATGAPLCSYRFGDDFLFGAGSSAYQVEGAWNESGKGISVWDDITHNHPEKINDGSNGDIACDSYHKYLEDVKIAKELGLNFYRFSISWTRILPNGLENKINPYGLDYYNKLIDALLANGIEPVITLLHWDLPLYIHQMGGLSNSESVKWFTNYAKIVFDNFGDRVKYWMTFNEPTQYCSRFTAADYNDFYTPVLGSEMYLCGKNLLLSHAKVYHLYKDEYKHMHKGSIGIGLDSMWSEPYSDEALDIAAAGKMLQFSLGWFANPIYSKTGDYPPIMIDRIKKRSIKEGFKASRLPKFTKKEIEFIRGTYDFFGINNYGSVRVSHAEDAPIDDSPTFLKDVSVTRTLYENFTTLNREGEMNAPAGLRSLLNWIKDSYGDVPIIIPENGVHSSLGIEDKDRVLFYNEHLKAVWNAKYVDKVNVIGYSGWSLMDSFEMMGGYQSKYGFYEVDFNDPERPRTPKLSAKFYANVTSTRCLL